MLSGSRASAGWWGELTPRDPLCVACGGTPVRGDRDRLGHTGEGGGDEEGADGDDTKDAVRDPDLEPDRERDRDAFPL